MEEQTLYGMKACMALLERRPDDVLRLFFSATNSKRLGGILSWAASRKLPYRELDDESLQKVAKSTHHEGLVVVSRPLRYRELEPRELRQSSKGAGVLWLALDGVTNPHNLGAILRSCAFFGVGGVVVGGEAARAKVNSAVPRVAEGGAEMVPLYAAPELPTALGDLKQAGFAVIGLETDVEEDWWRAVENGAADGPTVLVLGNEGEGISSAVRKACTRLCVLRGPGELTSLNVSVTAAVALSGVARRR